MALQRIAAATSLFLLTVVCVSSAQDKNPKTHTLSMDVDLVLVNASVTDSLRNRPMNGLSKNNFQVWEDKVEQKITQFSSEDVPVSVGIIFDVSGSMGGVTAVAQRAAATFFKSGTKDDEYFEVMFASRPKVISDFTTDVNKLQQSLLSTPTKGSTALYDAVYLGLNKLKESNNPKRALLLITDGEDNSSRYSFSDVRDFVREQNIQIYAIDVTGSTFGMSRTLTQMSELTGGQTFFPGGNGLDMKDICRKIAVELKNQYVIGYGSTNSAKDGAWRKIKVAVNVPRSPYATTLTVRAKQGYYAPSGDEVTNKKK